MNQAQAQPQTSILIISSSSTIAQSLINELTQNPQNRLLLHVRPSSPFSHQVSDNIVHLTKLDLMNPEYALQDGGFCYNNAAYETWFEYVMSEYNPQIMVIATGVMDEPSSSNLLHINAAIPAKCSEMFAKVYNAHNSASLVVPLIVFMNSVSADYAPVYLGVYAQSKELMSHLLWSIYRKGASDAFNRCSVINAKIGPIDTALLSDGLLKDMSYIVKKMFSTIMVSPETAAKGLAHHIHLQTTRSYKTVYVPFWWRWINCFAWRFFYVINGFVRLIDMVIMMGSWR